MAMFSTIESSILAQDIDHRESLRIEDSQSGTPPDTLSLSLSLPSSG